MENIRNGTATVDAASRKKILLLCDDIRSNSGVAVMARSFVKGTVHRYHWVQIGASINHPEKGKFLDVSPSIQKDTGISDASVKILPWDSYGNADLLRQVINIERPDAILHFTDPRYWRWLYDIEHEIRQNIPILFYAIWDNVGTPPNFELDPLYNRDYYESCDGVFAISKQTYGMVKRMGKLTTFSTWKPMEDWQVSYVPHGIDYTQFTPVEVPVEYKKRILGNKEYDFILFWSNRNIRRKQPADVIYAYKRFCERFLSYSQAKRTCLLMHTNPTDEAGTDLPAFVKRLNLEGNVIFSAGKESVENLNYLYNMADCTINIAGNEGFGLTTAESVMAGTPIIVNVTGGLQDQCGFKIDGIALSAEDYIDIGTLHEYDKWEDHPDITWGQWVYPIWSRVRTISGSIPTPYLWDDKVDIEEVASAINWIYEHKSDLPDFGLIGREAFIHELALTHENMSKKMADSIDTVLENWKPKERFELFTL